MTILHADGRFEIDTDKSRLDRAAVHKNLSASYWAKNIPRDVVERSIEGADCFGVYEGKTQIGFARVITDGATFAYLGDVFVVPEYRGLGLGKWLVKTIMTWPAYAGFRRWLLATRDAHDLYRPFGFGALEDPAKFMEIKNEDVYSAAP